MPWYEIIGYLGSFLVAVSLTMKNILKLRWINFAGAAIFALYGGLIAAYPVLVLNGFIAVVDLVYLWQMYNQKDYFILSPADGPDDNYLNKFMEFYKEELARFFPEFKVSDHLEAKYYFILRNLVPAGLFVFEERSDDTIFILLDYATPDYRDLNNAKFLYYTADFMKEKGYKLLKTESHHKIHDKYLIKLGFEKTDDGKFVKEIN